MRIEKSYTFTVEEEYSKIRVDKYLSIKISDLSRSALTGRLCEIYINGNACEKSDKVSCGDEILLIYQAEVFEKVEPQNIPLRVLYEDSAMLVIDKEQGMVVHPGAGNVNGTVVNALAYRYGQDFIDKMADECDIQRPGIVHRLDKDTSGVMVIALTPSAHSSLSSQFQNRETCKYYYAVCEGRFHSLSGTVECNLVRSKDNRKLFDVSRTEAGKYSKTSWEVVSQYKDCALLKIRIFTGRTHQIRVHMKSIGHPVVGDVLYSKPQQEHSLMLHSQHLEIKHPVTGQIMVFEAPTPERFKEVEQ